MHTNKFDCLCNVCCAISYRPCQDWLVVRVSPSHMVGHGFASRPGHTKDHHNNATKFLPAVHACVRVGV